MTFSALAPEARFTLPAAGPPAPGSRRAAAGRRLDSRRGRPNLGLRPVGHPLLETRSAELGASFCVQRLVTAAVGATLFAVHVPPHGSYGLFSGEQAGVVFEWVCVCHRARLVATAGLRA